MINPICSNGIENKKSDEGNIKPEIKNIRTSDNHNTIKTDQILKNKKNNQLEETNVNEKPIANLNYDLTKKTLKKPIKKSYWSKIY